MLISAIPKVKVVWTDGWVDEWTDELKENEIDERY